MSFRIQQSPAFWSEIAFEVTPEEGGKPKEWKISVYFPRLNRDEFRLWLDHIGDDKVEDYDLATELLLGTWKRAVYKNEPEKYAEITPAKWKGVTDEEDNPLPISEGNVRALLTNTVGVDSAIVKKFIKEIGRAGTKN